MTRALLLSLWLAAASVHAQAPSWEMQVAGLDARLAAVDAAGAGGVFQPRTALRGHALLEDLSEHIAEVHVRLRRV